MQVGKGARQTMGSERLAELPFDGCRVTLGCQAATLLEVEERAPALSLGVSRAKE